MRTISKTLMVAGLVILAASFAQAAAPAELEPLTFLLGEWPSTGTGQPGQGSGTAVFSLNLQERVMMRSSYAEYPPANGKPKSRHDDLMVIYAASSAGLRADYFDSEGHLIHYAVQSPAPGEAVFVSDPTAGQPRFRLSYKLDAGVLKGKFEIATPDAPDTFKPYLAWESRKGKASK